MRWLIRTLAGLSLLCVASFSRADVITFETLPAGECGSIATPFTLGNWVFSRSIGDLTCVNSATPTSNGLRFSSNGTQTLGFIDFPNANGDLTVSHVAGSRFSLAAIDLAEFFKLSDGSSSNNATGVTIKGTHANSTTVTVTAGLDNVSDGVGGVADFQSFALGSLTDLVSVTFVSTNGPGARGYFLMDNLDLQVAAVAEPGSLALVGAALGAFGFSRRRRNK